MTSMNDYASVEVPYQQVTQKCCKFRYKVRCFHSKGAFLVLIWIALISSTYSCLFNSLLNKEKVSTGQYFLLGTPAMSSPLVCSPLSGWLADMRFGNYRVFKAGHVLLFLGATMNCMSVLVFENVSEHRTVSTALIAGIILMVLFVGGILCVVTALQLGLDQMPDASATNITSFIAWFVFSIAAGSWLSDAVFFLPVNCAGELSDLVEQVVSIFPVICMSVVCCSLFLLAPKWLTIEPRSPKSLKTIYQVLKFAVKYKAPINRSALTYWEENVPSRIDLGKSRYGGPFTTEQVEDVKTFFKILMIFLPFFIVSLASAHFGHYNMHSNVSCTSKLLYMVTYSPWWYMIITTLIYEFCVYPLLRNRLPSILKRKGFISFLVLLANIGYLIVTIIDYVHPFNPSPWLDKVSSALYGLITTLLMNWTTQFVCAQSPYSMRGLLTGYVASLYFISIAINSIAEELFKQFCHKGYCSVIQVSLSSALSLIGFILYCILARWYKKRVREDIYNPHRVVEEVYDRYLTHEQRSSHQQ